MRHAARSSPTFKAPCSPAVTPPASRSNPVPALSLRPAASAAAAESPLRVLHVIPQFPYFGGRTIVGGHASSLLTLSLAQSAAGHRVTVLSYTQGRAPDPQEISPRFDVASLFRLAKPGSVAFGLQFMRAAASWIRARRHDFDIIHAHSGFADYIPVSWTLKRASGLPTIHSMYCPVPASGRWNAPGVRALIRRSAHGLDAITAMSVNVADSLRAFGISPSELSIVHPPIDLDRFAPGDASESRARLGLAPDDLAVLFVGNAKAQKNLSRLLDAFAIIRGRHPRAKLIITTELKQSSANSHMDALRQKAQILGLEHHIIPLRIVSDMPALMRACDVLAAPFLDSFGPSDYFMAAMEAMATGKPVIASTVGGMPEVISPANGRLVDPMSVEQIASALEELLSDAALRQRLGLAARATLEAGFSPPAILRQSDDLYRDILASV